MSKVFHLNPKTGDVGVCKQKTGKCPFRGVDGKDNHFSSEEEARSDFEDSQSHKALALTVKKKSNIDFIALDVSTPLDFLRTKPLKEMGSASLTMMIMKMSDEFNFDREKIESSIALATILHSHQTRGARGVFKNTPYIEHPLRNTLRLLRYGVKDQNVIIAAVLHDTVEDGAQKFVKTFYNVKTSNEVASREILKNHILKSYGPRVSELVEGVTNDYIEETETREEMHARYYAHVKESIEKDPDVLLVKLTDFIDNATGLYNNDVPERALKTYNQARKYLPLVEIFRKELMNDKVKLSNEAKAEVQDALIRTTTRLTQIINKYS